ncbi:MAG: ATP-binding cassette domain-containing protein [Bacteroidales bacterium]|nr:ATP-binding cassette domain-containing protein [Bacteroidales bacterium]
MLLACLPYRRVAPYMACVLLSVLLTMATALSVADFLRLLFQPGVGVGQADLYGSAVSGNLVAQALELLYVRFVAEGPQRALLLFSLLLLLLYGLKNLFSYLAAVQGSAIRIEVARRLRNGMMASTLRRPMSFFTASRRGDIVARFGSDIAEFDESFLASLLQLATSLTSIVLYLAMLFYLSAKLTLAALLALPLVVFVISGISRKLKRKSEAVQRATAMLVALTGEAVEGARVIKAHTAIDYVRSRFNTLNHRLVAMRTRMFKRIYLASPVSDFLGNCVVVGVMLFGAMLASQRGEGLSASLFVSYVMLFVLLLPPGKEISTAWSQLRKGAASGQRIADLLQPQPTPVAPPSPQTPLSGADCFVEFCDVSFSYGTQPDAVLRGVSFAIEPGTLTALVGASGSGKSTIVDLLLRFYEPTGGIIKVHGRPLADEPAWLSRVAVARQLPQLMSGSVADNIRFGSAASISEVAAAARLAGADAFISQLPGGYAAQVGEGGCNLSGGQRARISIARALLRRPRLLILDEPTAALDAESEALVMDSVAGLRRLCPHLAILLIAHRLSTVRRADQILTLDGGVIVERGTHQELLSRRGRYAALAALQHLALVPLLVLSAALAMLVAAPAARADTIPLPLNAAAVGYNMVNLSWSPPDSSDNQVFTLYRQYPADTAPQLLVSTRRNSYTDTLRRVVCSDTVLYLVCRTSPAAPCARGSAAVFISDPRPTTPCRLHSVSVDSASQHIVLRWHPSPDSDIMGYFICTGTPCLSLDTVWGRHDTSYLAATLSPLSSNTFRIYAFDSCLTASPLTQPAGNIVLSAEATHCGSRLSMQWSAAQALPDTIEGYELQAAPSADSLFRVFHYAAGAVHSHAASLPPSGGELLLRVAACGRGGAVKAYSNIVKLRAAASSRTARHLHIFKVAADTARQGATVGCFVDTSYKVHPYTLWRRTMPLGPSSADTASAADTLWHLVASFYPDNPAHYISDTLAPLATAFCQYRLSVLDSCETATSFSNQASSLLLQVTSSDFYGLSLRWHAADTAHSPFQLHRRFTDNLHEHGWQHLATCSSDCFTDNLRSLGTFTAPLQYQVMTVSPSADTPAGLFDTAASNIVQYRRHATLYIPNAFTPDAASNNRFCISHTFLDAAGYSLSVYSRNGLRLFHTTDPSQCWDGTHAGTPLPAASYIYHLTYTLHGTGRRQASGTVTLIR